VGVLAALVGRAGTDVRTNLVNGAHFLMSDLVRRPDGAFDGMTRSGADLVGEHPAEALYQVADGWIAVAARDEEMAQRLVDAVAPDLPTTPLSRWGRTHREVLEGKFRAMNRSEALELLSASDVWAAPCVDDGWKALKADPGLRSGGAVVEGAASRFGVARQVGQLFTVVGADAVDDERGRIDPPGSHSRAILDEIGLSETEIGELLDAGVVTAAAESTS
jgi:crotonobetainyl-CoA:carnitine CoA-transferase CaiB-like acyl-CoA transferase